MILPKSLCYAIRVEALTMSFYSRLVDQGFEVKSWLWSAVLGVAAIYFVVNRGDYTLLDAFELAIHEAGHLFFAPFGEFLRMAGGTLLQLIVPVALVFGFFKGEYRPGVQFSLFLLGHSLLNVSVYAQDARTQWLPLVGGPNARHDWNWMLGTLGLLPWDHFIGWLIVAVAIVVFGAMIMTPKVMH
jgi:hypothetical protein